MKDTLFFDKPHGKAELLSPFPMTMGILNITPDSFYDGGKYATISHCIERVNNIVSEGSSIVDMGAYSSRPGAKNITEEEETRRLIPILKEIRRLFPKITISIDTFRANVAEKAISHGANMINDISGGTMDNQMFSIIAKYDIPYVLTHILGTPQNMQKNPIYEDITGEIMNFFSMQLEKLDQLGAGKTILDPGFGFGKTVDHNYTILKDLNKFTTLSKPLLIGVSRKSMITKLLNTSSDKALTGTTAIHSYALLNGAHILRVHDVKDAEETIQIINKIRS